MAKKEVQALRSPFVADGSANAQLQGGVERRFDQIIVKMGDQEMTFLDGGEHAGVTSDETRMLVYATVMALNSPGSKGGDGGLLYLAENIEHPKVKKLLDQKSDLVFTIKSDRSGVAGYRFNGSTIRSIVDAYAPAISESIREFGFPRPSTRGGKKEVEEVAVDFDF
jgi:hypothetical protein